MIAKRIIAESVAPKRRPARRSRARNSASSRTGTGWVFGFLGMCPRISLVYDSPSIKIFAFCALLYTIAAVAETKPIPVRLDEGLRARLKDAAKRMGTNRAAVIRFLTSTFLDHFEQSGGIASLPHNWREIMRLQDGRAFGQVRAAAVGRPATSSKRKQGRLRDIAEVSLPVYGNLPAGWPQTRDGVAKQEPDRMVRVKRGGFPEGAFGLDVRGDSMNNAPARPRFSTATLLCSSVQRIGSRGAAISSRH